MLQHITNGISDGLDIFEMPVPGVYLYFLITPPIHSAVTGRPLGEAVLWWLFFELGTWFPFHIYRGQELKIACPTARAYLERFWLFFFSTRLTQDGRLRCH